MSVHYSDLGMSIKMRLYSFQKRHVLLVILTFVFLFFFSVNFGVLGPQMLKTISSRASNQSTKINLKTGPFILVTPYLSRFHQQLWITAQPIISGRKEDFSKSFILNIHLYEKNDGHNNKIPDARFDMNMMSPESYASNKEEQSVTRSLFHAEYFNRTRYMHCFNEICDVISIVHLDYLHKKQYQIEIKFLNLDDLAGLDFKDIVFTFNSYNPSFTKLELWFRFTFLFVNFIVIIVYTNSLKKFSLRDWTIEQKWMFILLRSLIFFNNPLFPLNVLVDSWIPHVLDAIFQSTFLALVMVFWLSVYHGVRQNDRNFLTFYVPKFVIVFLIWLLSIVLLLWQQYYSLDDPTYNLTMDENNYIVFRILYLLNLIVYLLFLLYLIIRAYAELKNMPYFNLRIKFSLVLMMFVIAVGSTIAFFRIKSEPFRQSLFENFTKNYRNSVEFCAIFSIFNLYVYTLAFVYAPAKNASLDTDYKDNPTFSMLNDTDGEDGEEDIVYGMDSMKHLEK